MKLPIGRHRWWIASLLGTAAVALVILCVELWGSPGWAAVFWHWLTRDESGITTIRNIVLAIAPVAALGLTIWRIRVADRQAETVRQGLLYDRYQKGAEMLGSTVLAVRLGGIYLLQRLATEQPEHFLRQIVQQYCAFVRHPPESKEGATGGGAHASRTDSKALREDVRAVLNVMVGFLDHPDTIAVAADLALDLRGADLSGADLSNARLGHVDLSGAELSCADLSGAWLDQAWVAGASFQGADVSGTWFSSEKPFSYRVRGLTQDQLDEACADPEDRPKIEGLVGQHGAPLQWRGRPKGKRRPA